MSGKIIRARVVQSRAGAWGDESEADFRFRMREIGYPSDAVSFEPRLTLTSVNGLMPCWGQLKSELMQAGFKVGHFVAIVPSPLPLSSAETELRRLVFEGVLGAEQVLADFLKERNVAASEQEAEDLSRVTRGIARLDPKPSKPATASKPLEFHELAIGDCFVGFPEDGDDSGHGGFRRGHWLLRKTHESTDGWSTENNYVNVPNPTSGGHLPPHFRVLKVLA